MHAPVLVGSLGHRSAGGRLHSGRYRRARVTATVAYADGASFSRPARQYANVPIRDLRNGLSGAHAPITVHARRVADTEDKLCLSNLKIVTC